MAEKNADDEKGNAKKDAKKETKTKEKPEKAAAAEKKQTKKAEAKDGKLIIDTTIEPFETLQFVLMTEKCVRLIESQNKLVFIVRRQAGRKQIRKAAESAFQSRVAGVNTMIDQKGRKRAYIKFQQPGAAGDIAIRLGII